MSSVVDETRRFVRDLAALFESEAALVPGAAVNVRDVLDEMDRDAGRDLLDVVVVAPEAAERRAFINTIAGEELLPADARAPEDARISVRHGPEPGYRARLRGERVIEFADALPDREEAFAKAALRAGEAKTAASESLEATKVRRDAAVATAIRRAQPTLAAANATASRRLLIALRALWRWLVAFFFSGHGGEARLSGADARKKAFDEEVALAETRLEQASHQMARVSEERTKYADERRREYVSDVRSLSDRAGRGIELVELVVEFPCRHLAPGFALVDAEVSPRDVAGCIVVGSDRYDEEAWRELCIRFAPLVPRRVGGAVSLPPALEQIREDWPDVVVGRAKSRLAICVREARSVAVRIEIESRANLAELERQRLPDPVTFRTALVAEMADAIAAFARDIEKDAMASLRLRMDDVRQEWTSAIDRGQSRSEVEASVERLKEMAPATLTGLIDGIGEEMLRGMQHASEKLQHQALDRMRAQYRSRGSYTDEAAPVIVEMSDEIASIEAVPLAAAFEVFEKRRVELGIGGAAAGALLGTAILPGLGTAVGAILGVLAGFAEGTTKLKELCVGQIREHLDRVEQQLIAHLQMSGSDVTRDIRVSVEATLEQALARREHAILQLLDAEARALRRVKDKLAHVVALLDRLHPIEEWLEKT